MAKENDPEAVGSPNSPEFPDVARRSSGSSTRSPEQHVVHAEYGGPLPPSAEFQGYDAILPGAANRILTRAEKEQSHRHDASRLVILAETQRLRRGQWFGLLVVILCLMASVGCAWLGQPWPASIIGGAALISITTVFVTGQRARGRESRPEQNSDADKMA